ncbi:hypothetical protein [Streptomyces parvus]|uniref:hypothetical protein n=1 Tax=Streptomyces parvus TaxID=66428 RepID=UPI003D73F9B8
MLPDERDADVQYMGEYRYRNDATWYAAGNIYGYPTIEEARAANAKEVARKDSKGRVVARTRVCAVVTTSFYVEEAEA